jgi:hypothetical protein
MVRRWIGHGPAWRQANAGRVSLGQLKVMPYFHVAFTLPARIAAIAYQNKAVVYDLLFRAAAETVLTIAADPKHLGASPRCSTPGARP